MTRAKKLLMLLANSITNNILVSDTFTRGNNNTTLGNAETGQPWVVTGGAYGINNNKAVCVTNVVQAGSSTALVEAGKSDVTVTCDLTYSSYSGILLRAQNDSNNYRLRISNGALNLYKVVNGTANQWGTYTFTFVSGTTYSIKAVLNGSRIKCYLNDTLVIDVYDSTFLTQTKFGLFNYNGAGTTGTDDKYDNFKIAA